MTTPLWRTIYDRFSPLIAAILIVACAILAGATYVNDRNDARQDRARISDNESNAVTNCLNANESREASRALWNFVLDSIVAGNPPTTPEEAAFVTDFRAYVGKVYAARDCNDLSRKYPLPPPPTIPAS